MEKKRIGILGATGAVGMEMKKILEERHFPIKELRLLASGRSAGKKIPFAGGEVTVQEAAPEAFAGLDIVLGAAENDIARAMAPHIRAAGAVFIDNSSAFRLDADVPLIVPEINGCDAKLHHGLIANPNCSTIIALMALYGIHREAKITRVVAATYQAVSGAGAAGPRELAEETESLLAGKPVVPEVFPY